MFSDFPVQGVKQWAILVGVIVATVVVLKHAPLPKALKV